MPNSIQPDDGAGLQRFLEQLSPDSVYFRFFNPRPDPAVIARADWKLGLIAVGGFAGAIGVFALLSWAGSTTFGGHGYLSYGPDLAVVAVVVAVMSPCLPTRADSVTGDSRQVSRKRVDERAARNSPTSALRKR